MWDAGDSADLRDFMLGQSAAASHKVASSRSSDTSEMPHEWKIVLPAHLCCWYYIIKGCLLLLLLLLLAVGECQGPEQQLQEMRQWLCNEGSPYSSIEACRFSSKRQLQQLEFDTFERRKNVP
jgi:hypothetical protein